MVDYGLNSPWFPDPIKCFSEIFSTASREIINRSVLHVLASLSLQVFMPSPLLAFLHVQITMERLICMASRDLGHALHILLLHAGGCVLRDRLDDTVDAGSNDFELHSFRGGATSQLQL